MHVIDWLFSIEHGNRMVFTIGSIYLMDLYYAIAGFLAAQRFINNDKVDPFFPGFQNYVENYYSIEITSKCWAMLITARTDSPQQAKDKFYELLHQYHDAMPI